MTTQRGDSVCNDDDWPIHLTPSLTSQEQLCSCSSTLLHRLIMLTCTCWPCISQPRRCCCCCRAPEPPCAWAPVAASGAAWLAAAAKSAGWQAWLERCQARLAYLQLQPAHASPAEALTAAAAYTEYAWRKQMTGYMLAVCQG